MPFTFLSTSQMVDCLSACFVNALASRPSVCLHFILSVPRFTCWFYLYGKLNARVVFAVVIIDWLLLVLFW